MRNRTQYKEKKLISRIYLFSPFNMYFLSKISMIYSSVRPPPLTGQTCIGVKAEIVDLRLRLLI